MPKKYKEELVKQFHFSPVYRHQGIYKTYKRFKRQFNFPGSKSVIINMVKDYEVCVRIKALQYKLYREL